jgi:hypothetical protein
MEKCELQRMCEKLFEQLENCKTSSIYHLQRLESFGKEKDLFIKKIKSVEDALIHLKLPLEKPCDYDMSNNNATSSSHAIPAYRTMFVKPGIEVKGTNLSLLVIFVVLLVILVLIAFNYALRSHGIKSMHLGIMSLILEIRSIIYVIKLSSSVKN